MRLKTCVYGIISFSIEQWHLFIMVMVVSNVVAMKINQKSGRLRVVLIFKVELLKCIVEERLQYISMKTLTISF